MYLQMVRNRIMQKRPFWSLSPTPQLPNSPIGCYNLIQEREERDVQYFPGGLERQKRFEILPNNQQTDCVSALVSTYLSSMGRPHPCLVWLSLLTMALVAPGTPRQLPGLLFFIGRRTEDLGRRLSVCLSVIRSARSSSLPEDYLPSSCSRLARLTTYLRTYLPDLSPLILLRKNLPSLSQLRGRGYRVQSLE
jgi:hypothetical protein